MTTTPDTTGPFRAGDRVTLSNLGRTRLPRTSARQGTVVKVVDFIRGVTIRVKWDEIKTPMNLNPSSLERIIP